MSRKKRDRVLVKDGIHGLTSAQLKRRCVLGDLSIETTMDLEPLEEVLGQPRAVEAIRLGVAIKGDGYNIFAIGNPGTGRRSLIRQFLEQRIGEESTPDDWCYVNNFADPAKPMAVNLPAGSAPGFSYDLTQLIEDVRNVLPKAFETDEYRNQLEDIQKRVTEAQQELAARFSEKAEVVGLTIIWSPAGVMFVPVKDGSPMSSEEIEELTDEERVPLEEASTELQQEMATAMREIPIKYRESRHALEKLNREVARQAFEPLVDELRSKYCANRKVLDYIDSLESHLTDHALSVIQSEQGESETVPEEASQSGLFDGAHMRAYRVNMLVSHEPNKGAPIVYDENPSVDSLIGRVEYLSQMGTLSTDFNLIKPGVLHRANGGYLILHAHRVLSSPFAWEALKQALRCGEIRIEPPSSTFTIVNTISLEPEPVPLNVKVILLGSRLIHLLLQQYDPDFPDMFRVTADFADDMERGNEEDVAYVRLLATLIQRHNLPPLDRSAVERVLEQASRMAGDNERLSIRIRSLTGLLRESAYWSHRDDRDVVTGVDVQRAVESQIYRSDRVQERLLDGIRRGVFNVQTTGAVTGQINGLAVFGLGDRSFGQPTRITARTRMGKGTVVDIEREVELGGPTHSKGVLILQGFLTERYARTHPFALTASLVFEQSYGGVDGDSASCAELIALLSSIAGVPILQSLAITGSISQQGEVQAIGGVNEKIEGFFDACTVSGRHDDQGVVIPKANVQHLMLRDDVIAAVEDGKFNVYAVSTVDEAVTLLTGMETGELDTEGVYPEQTFNRIVADALYDAASRRRAFAKGDSDDAESGKE